MQQYIIYGWDATDANALDRRMTARPAHFDNGRKWKESGNYVFGGAVLNDEGKMIGSTMVMQFETREGLQEWLDTEPYITGNVWERVDIRPFKVASL